MKDCTIKILKRELKEFLSWLSGLGTQHSVHVNACSIPGLTQWVKDSVFLWLRDRSAAAAPIQLLARVLSYAAGAALGKKKKKEREREN